MLISEMRDEYFSYYEGIFFVSPAEKYITLIKGWSGADDYAIVIKGLQFEDYQDVFVLTRQEIIDKYPDIPGSLELFEWSEDGRYFYAKLFAGAITYADIRIDTTDWSWEVYEMPPKTLGAYLVNYATGWMPYAPSAVWTGMDIMTDMVREEAAARGQTSPLYLYNIYTEEMIKIYEVTENPIWDYGPPQWLSDSELEYKLPGKETRVYTIK